MEEWQKALKPYTEKSNLIAAQQLAVTFAAFFAVWFLYIETLHLSTWLVLPFSIVTSLIVLRFFVLMHDQGHGVHFESEPANKFFGYVTGVITGMPQYVWSKHHAYHHATNGNWEKYRGPLVTISTPEYAALNEKQKNFYWMSRNPSLMPIAGFYYVLFAPRYNWIMGCLEVGLDFLRSLTPFSDKKPLAVLQACKSKRWKSAKEFRHMTYNNVTLLTIWFLMCQSIGTFNFFIFYVPTLCLSGGLGILIFVTQHNFEHAYATDTKRVDYIRAALEGSSFLILPKVLNWFTADIAYHHIHHLSTTVPNYHLADCHNALKDLFTDVKRIRISDIPHCLKYIIWDTEQQKLISKAEYQEIYG